MTILVLIRHGESMWNLENRFTGWTDVPLSSKGIKEAQKASEILKKQDFDVAFTSKLTRAQQTLMIILAKQKKTGTIMHEYKKRKEWSKNFNKEKTILIYEAEELNERYYGLLQGLNKEETKKKYGAKKVFEWRRSYNIKPPKGESLKDVYERTIPYFKKNILPLLKKRKKIIISAHGNSLRALIKYLENISDTEIPLLELKTGQPITYKYEKNKFKKINLKN